MNYRKQQMSVHVMGIKVSNICLIYDLCNANICMYVQTYGIGFFDETLGPRNGICSCFFMIRLGPHWHVVKLERASDVNW